MSSFSELFQIQSKTGRMSAMEGLRAYAAGIVYVLHLVSSFAYHHKGVGFGKLTIFEFAEIDPLYVPLYWLYRSQYGVDIFFLLSGYLIAGLVIKHNFNYLVFLYHRFLRIYPTLIVSTLAYVGYSMFIEGGPFWLRGVVGNLLLLNGIPGFGFPHVNIVTWSLFFEFAFYFSFPLLWMACRGQLKYFLLLSVLVIAQLLILNDSYIRFLMFLAGVALKVAPNSFVPRTAAWLKEWAVVLLYFCATTAFVFVKSWVLFIPIYLFPAMLLVSKALHGNGVLSRVLSLAPVRYFGNISFSFYLFHLLGLSVSRDILALLGIQNDWVYFSLYCFLSFTISFALSALCFVFVEKQYFKNKALFDRLLAKVLPKRLL